MRTVSALIPYDLAQQLEKACEKDSITKSEMIRLGLSEYLLERAEELNV